MEMEAGHTLLLHGLVRELKNPEPTNPPAEPKQAGQEKTVPKNQAITEEIETWVLVTPEIIEPLRPE